MGQIDTTKSVISSLRHALTLLMSILFISVGFLIRDYRDNHIDAMTIFALILVATATVSGIFVQKAINKKSKELRDM